MGKRWNFLFVLVLVVGLYGCEKPKPYVPNVVTQIQIRCVHDGVQIQRHYTDSGSTSAVLDCLRLQRRKGTAQVDPERVLGDVYEIRIGLSDGTEHIYRYRGGQYMSKDSRPWQIVSRESGAQLYEILCENI